MIIFILTVSIMFQRLLLIKNVFFHNSLLFEMYLYSMVSFWTENNYDKEKHDQTDSKRNRCVITGGLTVCLRKLIQEHRKNGQVQERKNVRKNKVSINQVNFPSQIKKFVFHEELLGFEVIF